MSRSVELSDEDYARLERAAEVESITPAEWVARRIPRLADPGPCVNGKPARTMADVLAARIGRVSSGNGDGTLSERHSEDFCERLDETRRAEQAGSADTGVAKPMTMAERLAGRIGTLSGSGGQPSSDNVVQSFAEHLEAKQRQGRL